jgi:hypothetical protein
VDAEVLEQMVNVPGSEPTVPGLQARKLPKDQDAFVERAQVLKLQPEADVTRTYSTRMMMRTSTTTPESPP